MTSNPELWGHPVVTSDVVPEGEVWVIDVAEVDSKPVLRVTRWEASTCSKCNGPVYLCVEPGGERTWTEHQCSAKTAEQQHINACR